MYDRLHMMTVSTLGCDAGLRSPCKRLQLHGTGSRHPGLGGWPAWPLVGLRSSQKAAAAPSRTLSLRAVHSFSRSHCKTHMYNAITGIMVYISIASSPSHSIAIDRARVGADGAGSNCRLPPPAAVPATPSPAAAAAARSLLLRHSSFLTLPSSRQPVCCTAVVFAQLQVLHLCRAQHSALGSWQQLPLTWMRCRRRPSAVFA